MKINWDSLADKAGYENLDQMFKKMYRRWPWETEKFTVAELADIFKISALSLINKLKERKLFQPRQPYDWDAMARELGHKGAWSMFLKVYATCEEDKLQGKKSMIELGRILGVAPQSIGHKLRALGIKRAPAHAPFGNQNNAMKIIDPKPAGYNSEREWLKDLCIKQKLPRYMVCLEIKKYTGWQPSTTTIRYRLARLGLIEPYWAIQGDGRKLFIAPDDVKLKQRGISKHDGTKDDIRSIKGTVSG